MHCFISSRVAHYYRRSKHLFAIPLHRCFHRARLNFYFHSFIYICSFPNAHSILIVFFRSKILTLIAFSYCIEMAISDSARFAFGFRLIDTVGMALSEEAAFFRGGRVGELRLLKNVTVLHLAVLHASNEASATM
jgi:hypothetical protein